jgi:hypothetical protein
MTAKGVFEIVLFDLDGDRYQIVASYGTSCSQAHYFRPVRNYTLK